MYISTNSVEPTSMDCMLTTVIYILFFIYLYCFILLLHFKLYSSFLYFLLASHFSYQFSLVTQSWLILYHNMDWGTPGLPVHHQLQDLLRLMSTELVMPSNHLILCCPLSSHLQSFPASGSFPVSQFFASGGQSFGVSASASVLQKNTKHWFPLEWTGWLSL